VKKKKENQNIPGSDFFWGWGCGAGGGGCFHCVKIMQAIIEVSLYM
jgi:hypothetical protein